MSKIAFLGTGNMASAIIRGAVKSTESGITGKDLVLFNRSAAKYANFADLDAVIADSASDAVARADIIFLAVKPQNFAELLEGIRESGISLDGKLFVSIAAGISTAAIAKMLAKQVPVVRCMPNTPLQIGMGVTAVSRNELVTDEDYDFVCGIFSCAGMVLRLEEDQMNTVICASGSSPAYFYYFIDAMVKSAKAQGLDCENLTEAICKTLIGAATMLMASGKTPEELIRAVTSPKGTTERAMTVLTSDNVGDSIDRAMRACTDRAEEMAHSFG